MELKAKPKKKQGRPKKNLDPDKAFTWFDETAWIEAKKQFDLWEEAYIKLKGTTGGDWETIEQYEQDLRGEFPDLDKLSIDQLYILKGRDKADIQRAFSDVRSISKPPLDKEHYTVKIPAEKANEYSWYLSICEAFNSIREAGNTNINVSMLPRMTANRIVLNVRAMKLEPNHYLFNGQYK